MLNQEEVAGGLGVVLVILIFAGGHLAWNYSKCETQAQSFVHEYEIPGGCMVEHKGKWVPLENLRGYGE